CVLYFIGARVF
nr:immunoglobulin light chain junction region [Macaca mulatta]MPN86195.1 immunoglobulin light chain junction region [Macaca mulatta]